MMTLMVTELQMGREAGNGLFCDYFYFVMSLLPGEQQLFIKLVTGKLDVVSVVEKAIKIAELDSQETRPWQ